MLNDVWKAWGAELAFTSVRFLPSPSWKRAFHMNSLPVQWLGLSAFTTGWGGPGFIGELRSCKQRGTTKKKKKKVAL